MNPMTVTAFNQALSLIDSLLTGQAVLLNVIESLKPLAPDDRQAHLEANLAVHREYIDSTLIEIDRLRLLLEELP